jgi:hypothetical protein
MRSIERTGESGGWFLSFPLGLGFLKITFEVVAISCGRLSVTEPVAADAVTWFVVPEIEVTPVLAIVIVPDPFVTLMPVPFAIVASEYPEPFPIRS